ncbi:MAG: NPCBM/NEW2 domain-containing protein [Planctomycetia bacterium]|nr:NPCBM/NEW2 domain-containing protein [Planctomycetia bacterium]
MNISTHFIKTLLRTMICLPVAICASSLAQAAGEKALIEYGEKETQRAELIALDDVSLRFIDAASADAPETPAAKAAQTLPLNTLRLIHVLRAESSTPTDAPIRLSLSDGSVFNVANVEYSAGKITLLQKEGGETKTLPIQSVKNIVFQTKTLDKEDEIGNTWRSAVEKKRDADLLAVVRGDALAYYDGTILEVTNETIRFDLDGDAVVLKRDRIFGLAFGERQFHAGATPATTDPTCLVSLPGGGEIHATRVLLGERSGTKRWTIHAASGPELAFDYFDVEKIDFRIGRYVFLSSLKPESVEQKPFFNMPNLSKAREDFLAPGSGENENDFQISPKTKIVFRIPGKFQTFSSSVGIAENFRPRGSALVKIFLDDALLWEQTISGKDEPVEIKLDVVDGKRLSILVDYGENADWGDRVVFQNARFLK